MAITRLAIAGYRSFRDTCLALAPLTVVTGANGSGKSSLYRALRLLADIAQGRIVQSLAAEGGLNSTLWAGPESFSRGMREGTTPVQGVVRKGPVGLRLGFSSEDYGYAIDLGLPPPPKPTFDGSPSTKFGRDPEIKVESVWTGERLDRANEFARRDRVMARVRDDSGAWRQVTSDLALQDSMMTFCADPDGAPELLQLRETMRGWRFYDHLRTDPDATARRPQVGTFTPVLSGDGADLAAALQTIIEIGARDDLATTIADAFAGAAVTIVEREGFFELEMRQHGLLRPLRAAELSDGTLRYLMLAAALLSPRPPALMVLNEPETSLHPDLLAPLGRLIATASARSQVIVVSHARALVAALEGTDGCRTITLEKQLGETRVADADRLSTPSWTWPTR